MTWRVPQDGESRLSFGTFVLDLEGGCVRDQHGEIPLRRKSFGVLRHLVLNAGRLVSKDEIITAVWPTTDVSDASLAQCISEVRLALRDEQQQLIRTIVGRGYRFSAPVLPGGGAAPITSPRSQGHSEPGDLPKPDTAGEEEDLPRTRGQWSESTTIVGRDDELDWILRRWREACSGYGQVILLSGEAGIGKSRLVAEFLARTSTAPRQRLRYTCAAERSTSAYYPAIGEIETAAQVTANDPAPVRHLKLAHFLESLPLASSDRTTIASLLSLADHGAETLDPNLPERRQRTLDALLHRVEAQASIAPAIAIVEDFHWVDPTSLELFDRLVERTKELRLLVVLTFRPEIAPPWVGQHHVSVLTLNRLCPQDSRTLIARLSGTGRIAPDLVDVIVERSDGVPLFVEELTRAALDGDITLAQDVPASLQASLITRLERLGSARGVAQLSAAIGRTFPAALLAAISDLSAAELMPPLEQLLQSGLILAQPPRTDSAFTFRHTLFRDAALASIPERERRSLHIRIAEAMQQQYPHATSAAPEVIASHFASGGALLQAFHWWRRAGEESMHHAAFEEALAHFSKAIEIADHVSSDDTGAPVTATERLALQVAYGQTLLWVRSMESAIAAFARAREFAGLIDDSSIRFAAYYGLWAGNMMNARMREAYAVAEDFVRDTGLADVSTETGIAHRALGSALWFMGQFAPARDHLRRALDIYDPERDRGAATRFSLVPGPPARICLALACFALGESGEAQRLAETALTEAERIAHVPTQTYVLTHALMLHLFGRQASRAVELSAQLLRLSTDHALPHISYARVLDLATRFQIGHLPDAAHRMRLAVQELCSEGRRLGLPWFLSILAEMETAAGEPAIALATIDKAIAEAVRSGERWYESQIHHLRARLLLAQGRLEDARAALATALTVARDQQALGFASLISPTAAGASDLLPGGRPG
ncbi:AAA family ATPase [Bradyrhizobium sp. HKCCYLS2038]|uniref:AAA family ATPase n=1 Tax=unclassified Bradyrhizobium TaxID=2631580 RepID=UPI003EBDF09E